MPGVRIGQWTPLQDHYQKSQGLVLAPAPIPWWAYSKQPLPSGPTWERSEKRVSKTLSSSDIRDVKCSVSSYVSYVISLPPPFLSSSSKAQRKGQAIEENKIARRLLQGCCWIITYSTTRAENDEFNITQSRASYMSQKTAYTTQQTGSAARRHASLQLWGKWNDSHRAPILEAAWYSFGFNFIGKCPKEG